MEESKDELFESICSIKGHLFINDERDIVPEDEKDSLLKFCFLCDGYIQFYQYSPDMVDVLKSKVMCC